MPQRRPDWARAPRAGHWPEPAHRKNADSAKTIPIARARWPARVKTRLHFLVASAPPPHTGLAARPGTQCTLGMRGVAAVNARTQGAAEALFAGKSACGLLGFDSTLRMRSVLMMRTKPPLFLADCELDWSHIWHIKYKYKSINYIKLNLYKSFFLFIRAGLVAHLRGCWARKRGRGKGGEGVGKGGRVKEGG